MLRGAEGLGGGHTGAGEGGGSEDGFSIEPLVCGVGLGEIRGRGDEACLDV